MDVRNPKIHSEAGLAQPVTVLFPSSSRTEEQSRGWYAAAAVAEAAAAKQEHSIDYPTGIIVASLQITQSKSFKEIANFLFPHQKRSQCPMLRKRQSPDFQFFHVQADGTSFPRILANASAHRTPFVAEKE